MLRVCAFYFVVVYLLHSLLAMLVSLFMCTNVYVDHLREITSILLLCGEFRSISQSSAASQNEHLTL